MIDYISSVLYITVCSNIFLIALILSRGFKNFTNILFSLISFSVAIWSVFIFGFYEFPNSGFNWLAGTHISALFIALVFYYFSLMFPKKIYKNFNLYFWPALVFVLILYFIIFTDSIIGPRSGIVYSLSFGYLIYQIIFTAYSVLGFVFLKKQFEKANDKDEKYQVKYIFGGALLTTFLAMTTDLIFPYLGIFEFTWLGPIFTFFLVSSIFIAITRHHLFNIKIIATESCIFLLDGFLLIRLIISIDLQERLINGSLLTATAIVSYFLIRSVKKEIAQREHIEKLAGELALTNNRLEYANEKLKELDRQKTEFVSIASHQLRSPLTAIKGYSSMLLEGSFGPLPDKATEAVNRIFESSQKLVNVIEDFLNITRIELGRMKYTLTNIDLDKIAKQVIEEQKTNIDKHGLKIDFVSDGQNHVVYVDAGKVSQVFSNIIDNAVKYTPQGSIQIKLSSSTSMINKKKKGKEVVRFSAQDTGVGIDQKTMPNLFEKFVRADDAGETNITGTGLGLYVAKQIVDGLGGKIWAESAGQGQGSTFIVEFPKKN